MYAIMNTYARLFLRRLLEGMRPTQRRAGRREAAGGEGARPVVLREGGRQRAPDAVRVQLQRHAQLVHQLVGALQGAGQVPITIQQERPTWQPD